MRVSSSPLVVLLLVASSVGITSAFSPLSSKKGTTTRITSPNLKNKSVQLLLTTKDGAPFKLPCDQAKIFKTRMHVSTAVDNTYFNGSPPTVKQKKGSAAVTADRTPPSFLDSSPIERKQYLQKGFKAKIAKAMSAEAMPVATSVVAELLTTINTSNDERLINNAMLNLKSKVHEWQVQGDYSRLGGPLVVVTTMLKHPENEELQEGGLVTLTIASNDSPSIRDTTMEVGGVRAILQAMEAHPSSRSVQEAGIIALDKVCDPQPTHGLTTEAGGLPLIVRAMETFVDDEELVLLASQLLDRLSNVASSHEVMIDAQVLSALSTIVQTHRDNKDILTVAGRTMIRLVAV